MNKEQAIKIIEHFDEVSTPKDEALLNEAFYGLTQMNDEIKSNHFNNTNNPKQFVEFLRYYFRTAASSLAVERKKLAGEYVVESHEIIQLIEGWMKAGTFESSIRSLSLYIDSFVLTSDANKFSEFLSANPYALDETIIFSFRYDQKEIFDNSLSLVLLEDFIEKSLHGMPKVFHKNGIRPW